MSPVVIILFALNIVTLVLFGIDKYLAIHNRYRISEKSLLFLTIIGGSIGAISAQKLFRHKTIKFKYVLRIIILVQITVITIALYFSLLPIKVFY